MSKTKVVVYASGSKVPRRVVVSDSWTEAMLHPTHPAESKLHLSPEEPHDVHSLRRRIADHHGIPHDDIPSGRCVVAHKESGEILSAIMADPDVDDHEHHLVSHDHAIPGPDWRFHHGVKKIQVRKAVVPKKGPNAWTAIGHRWHDHTGIEHLPDHDDEHHYVMGLERGQRLVEPGKRPVGDAPSRGTRKI